MAVLVYSLPEQYTIAVNTKDMTASWRKFKVRVPNPNEYCAYSANSAGTLSILNHETLSLETISPEKWQKLWPIFFETHTYALSISFYDILEGTKPRIIHPNPEVVALFNEQQLANGYALLASLKFLNEPGHFALQFVYTSHDGREHTEKFEFDVVSPKLDTKDDLNIIIQQIRHEFGDLVFRYLTLTFQQFQQGKDANNEIIWLSVFKQIIDGYLRAVRFVINTPHNKTYQYVEYMRPDRIRHWTNTLALQYKNSSMLDSDRALHTYYRTEQLSSTNDTIENQFVKYSIERISERLNRLIRRIKDTSSVEEISALQSYSGQLEIYRRNPFFRTISRFTGFRQESMVLQQRNGYQQVYRYWLLLQNGLNLIDGDTSVGVQPIWKLYELWCFLRIKRLVREILEIDPIEHPEDCQRIEEHSHSAFDPFIGGDLQGSVTYISKNNDRVEVGYQYKFTRYAQGEMKMSSSTGEQKPDIIVNIHKPDGQTLTYLFDAKYRVKGDENSSIAIDEPLEETIDQMHRYRDAIYYGARSSYNFSKEVIGAYVLFPGRLNESEMLHHWISHEETGSLPYYLHSIYEVNVGAFPLLPNEQSGILLRYHLNDILLHKTPLQQIQLAVPQRGLQYLPTGEDGVLMVMMMNFEQKSLAFANGKVAIGIKMTDWSMDIIANMTSIRYILFHTRESVPAKNQHLFRLIDFPKIIRRDELSTDYYPNSQGPTVYRYILIHFNLKEELSESNKLDCSNKRFPFVKEERYDAQFAMMSNLL